jgi:hypothetical protein
MSSGSRSRSNGFPEPDQSGWSKTSASTITTRDFIRVVAAVVHNLRATPRAVQHDHAATPARVFTRDKTFRRKFKEVILAAHSSAFLQERHPRDLPCISGDGFYGRRGVTRIFQQLRERDLTIGAQRAARGLIQSPSSYAPTVNLDRAIARRNIVRSMMSTKAIDQASMSAKSPRSPDQRSEMKQMFAIKGQVRKELVEKLAALRRRGAACSRR